MSQELISAIKKIPKVRAVFIVTEGGVTGDDPGPSLEGIRKLLAELRGLSEPLSAPLTSLQLELTDTLAMIEDLGDGYLVVLGDKDMNVGRIRLQLRKFVKR